MSGVDNQIRATSNVSPEWTYSFAWISNSESASNSLTILSWFNGKHCDHTSRPILLDFVCLFLFACFVLFPEALCARVLILKDDLYSFFFFCRFSFIFSSQHFNSFSKTNLLISTFTFWKEKIYFQVFFFLLGIMDGRRAIDKPQSGSF